MPALGCCYRWSGILSKVAELVVGVIGGLGPEATLDFFGKVLHHSKATKDQDHIHVIIENNPKTPNRNDAIAGRGPSPAPALADMARALERAGADFVVMACNTAHAYEVDIRATLTKPFVSLIAEVVDEVRRLHPEARQVGVLATQGSRDAKIFAPAFARHGIEVVQLDEASQARFMALLYRIKAGERSKDIRNEMQQLGEELVAMGADILIAGCTEVPLVLQQGDNTKIMIDSTDVLARRSVIYARRIEPLPDQRETS
jgi:aspartate racemase